MQPHTCGTAQPEQKHQQLSSKFITSRLCNVIKHAQTMHVCATWEMVSLIWNCKIKYGKAWQAKQRALKLCYDDWDKAYERIPAMLHAMKTNNPGMHF